MLRILFIIILFTSCTKNLENDSGLEPKCVEKNLLLFFDRSGSNLQTDINALRIKSFLNAFKEYQRINNRDELKKIKVISFEMKDFQNNKLGDPAKKFEELETLPQTLEKHIEKSSDSGGLSLIYNFNFLRDFILENQNSLESEEAQSYDAVFIVDGEPCAPADGCNDFPQYGPFKEEAIKRSLKELLKDLTSKSISLNIRFVYFNHSKTNSRETSFYRELSGYAKSSLAVSVNEKPLDVLKFLNNMKLISSKSCM